MTEKAPQDWIEARNATSPGIVDAFMAARGEDPLAGALAAVDHQLSTDSDLEMIAGASKYRALRLQIRDAMARALGFAGYREEGK